MDVKVEKAVFVGIITDKDDESKVMEYLDELEFLAETAGATGDKKFVQRLERPDNATYIRSGKLQEIAEYCEENEINYVIFDDELSGTQQRNIEKIIKTASVIDRTSLILEIFAQRAKTAYAKTQVELAKYNYMLPRLAGMWTHLERQRGGMGTRGGIDHGKLAEHGTVEQIFQAPKSKEAKKLIYQGYEKVALMKGKRCVRIVFSENSSFEPVIANMVLAFKTPVNILYANTKDLDGVATGEMILQLPEDDVLGDKMIAYLKNTKLTVEELEDYVG